ncbi:MAG TPA: hypothetical protein VFZ24_00165 [Longimicrobiales bacterium]
MADTNRTRTDWSTEESFWRENYRTRPYADANRNFDYYRPGYKYGFESRSRLGDRPWNEAEPELRSGWDRYEGRGESKWEEIKDTVKDAWERVTGRDEDRTRR